MTQTALMRVRHLVIADYRKLRSMTTASRKKVLRVDVYICTLSSTSALDGGGYSLYRRLGGPEGRSGRVRKFSTPTGFEPRTVQPVSSRYTDYAIRWRQLEWNNVYTKFIIIGNLVQHMKWNTHTPLSLSDSKAMSKAHIYPSYE